MSTRVDPTPGYESVVSGPLKFAGVDQGIDFTGTGSVHALADGIVRKVVHSGSGWPGKGALLVYEITRGPAKGRFVYVAEDYSIAAGLRPGSPLSQGQVIGTVHSSYPGIEMGFAQPNGTPVAPLHPNPHSPKPAGKEFDAFVRGLSKAVGTALAAPGGSATLASSNAGAMGCATVLAIQAAVIVGVVYFAAGAPAPW